MKAICFSRVSTEAQTIESQKDELIKEAHRQGYSDDDIIAIDFKESGISLSKEDRRGIKMLEDCLEKTTDADCFICYEVSRIGRRADVIFYVRDLLLKHACRWIVLQPYIEVIDSSGKLSQMGNIMLGLFTTFSESEMTIKKERMRRGKIKAASEGKFIGAWIPYGYRVDEKKNIVIDEEAAQNVRDIFADYHAGLSYKTIAQKYSIFNVDKDGKAWTMKSGIRHIITNSAYTGRGKRYVVYPRIISDELFDAVQKDRAEHVTLEKSKKKYTYYCSKLIRDAVSGYRLNGSSALFRYQINSSCLANLKECMSISINLMDSITWEVACRVSENSLGSNQEAEIKKMIDYISLKKNALKAKKSYLETCHKKIDMVNKRIIDLKITEDKGDAMIAEIEVEMQETETEMMTIDNDLSNAIIYKTYLESVGLVNNDVRSITDDLQRCNIIAGCIKCISLQKNKTGDFDAVYTINDNSTIKLHINSLTREVTENNKRFDYQYLKRFVVRDYRKKKSEA